MILLVCNHKWTALSGIGARYLNKIEMWHEPELQGQGVWF